MDTEKITLEVTPRPSDPDLWDVFVNGSGIGYVESFLTHGGQANTFYMVNPAWPLNISVRASVHNIEELREVVASAIQSGLLLAPDEEIDDWSTRSERAEAL